MTGGRACGRGCAPGRSRRPNWLRAESRGAIARHRSRCPRHQRPWHRRAGNAARASSWCARVKLITGGPRSRPTSRCRRSASDRAARRWARRSSETAIVTRARSESAALRRRRSRVRRPMRPRWCDRVMEAGAPREDRAPLLMARSSGENAAAIAAERNRGRGSAEPPRACPSSSGMIGRPS